MKSKVTETMPVNDGTNWLWDLPQHIKIPYRPKNREKDLEEQGREPEPGYGLDGYPLQNWRRKDAGKG